MTALQVQIALDEILALRTRVAAQKNLLFATEQVTEDESGRPARLALAKAWGALTEAALELGYVKQTDREVVADEAELKAA